VDRIQAVQTPDALQDARFDLILITTKAFDTAVATVQIAPLAKKDTLVCIVQNGVGGIETAQGILGEHQLYAGVITIPVELPKPAVIRARTDRGGIGIASVNGENADPLMALFAEVGLRTRLVADWRSLKWSKLMLNILGNAIPAILDWPPEQVYANKSLYKLERDALREARTVVKELKVDLVSLPGYRVPLIVGALCALPVWSTHAVFCRTIGNSRNGKPPSLHLDLSRGREKSEVEFLNGAVARVGAKLGVPTPVNQVLYNLLLGIAQKQIPWDEYRGQADRLIGRVQVQSAQEDVARIISTFRD
jgi:2-dehydropantoate 2-reductase